MLYVIDSVVGDIGWPLLAAARRETVIVWVTLHASRGTAMAIVPVPFSRELCSVIVFAGEPSGDATQGPERVMATSTTSFGPAKTLSVRGAASFTKIEKGYSTVVPTCWFLVSVFTVGVARASLSESPWTPSARAALALSMRAATAARAKKGVLPRVPIEYVSPRVGSSLEVESSQRPT